MKTLTVKALNEMYNMGIREIRITKEAQKQLIDSSQVFTGKWEATDEDLDWAKSLPADCIGELSGITLYLAEE